MDLRPSHVHVFPPSRDLPAATSPHRETLLRSGCAWNGSLYLGYPLGQPQLTVQRLSLAAHERLDWQVHPMPSALYVLKGELRLETRDGAQSTRVLEGEAAGCLMNIIHRLIAGPNRWKPCCSMPAWKACRWGSANAAKCPTPEDAGGRTAARARHAPHHAQAESPYN
ncbi:hypothetical protein P4123_13150 [Pseudomonas aeruginosa]|nr:hypothetical protein [Pseudomonas aeruginosa]